MIHADLKGVCHVGTVKLRWGHTPQIDGISNFRSKAPRIYECCGRKGKLYWHIVRDGNKWYWMSRERAKPIYILLICKPSSKCTHQDFGQHFDCRLIPLAKFACRRTRFFLRKNSEILGNFKTRVRPTLSFSLICLCFSCFNVVQMFLWDNDFSAAFNLYTSAAVSKNVTPRKSPKK